jgi:CheY-like chemotaxis protein
MDIQMPVMDGLAAANELRASGYTHPVIALTAHAGAAARARCLQAGCDAYVGKPIDRAELLGTVSRFLRRADAANAPALSPAG